MVKVKKPVCLTPEGVTGYYSDGILRGQGPRLVSNARRRHWILQTRAWASTSAQVWSLCLTPEGVTGYYSLAIFPISALVYCWCLTPEGVTGYYRSVRCPGPTT